jgi:putative SOS response-associated peptidase YedK
MCGRYTLTEAPKDLVTEFGIVDLIDFKPRYNIAPTQDVPVIRLNTAGRRELAMMQWELIPYWAKDKLGEFRRNLARAESIETKPTFREPFKDSRCIVPISGFYEWQKLDKKTKQPYYIQRRDRKPMGLAGVWDRWNGDGEVIESFAIITTVPNELIEPLKDRMPVILHPEHYEQWLAPATPVAELKELLVPFPSAELTATLVSRTVNDARNDSPVCISPVSIIPDLFS